jgi:hypothetical protein
MGLADLLPISTAKLLENMIQIMLEVGTAGFIKRKDMYNDNATCS